MKRLLLFLPLLIITACQDEQGAELANEPTFLRFFGSEYSHTPKLALEDGDGFILLSTIDVPTEVLGTFQNKIKLIKTDSFGNLQWERVYPEFADATIDTLSLRASSLLITEEGYVVIGEAANMKDLSEPSSLVLLNVNFQGSLAEEPFFITGTENNRSTTSLHGKAIAKNQNGNYILLASVSNNDNDNTNDLETMMVTEVRSDNFLQVWARFYGDGTGDITNRIFIEQNNDLIFAGSQLSNASQEVRLLGFPQDRQEPILTASNAANTSTETANDVAEVFGGFPGYAILGTTNQNVGEDMYLIKFSLNGEQVFAPKTFDFDAQNDEGIAVDGTKEGGLILLGNGQSGEDKGFGNTDIFLVRLDVNGNEVWRKNFGGSAKDESASVRQTKDDGFLIFGSTEFGTNFKKLVLLKTDKNGELK